MQVSLLETDSDPARADLLIHVLNKLTCPLDQKLRAFKMHTKVGARSSILRNAASYDVRSCSRREAPAKARCRKVPTNTINQCYRSTMDDPLGSPRTSIT